MTLISSISYDKDFVDLLAQHCNRGELDPIHLLDVVLGCAALRFFAVGGRGFATPSSSLLYKNPAFVGKCLPTKAGKRKASMH